MLRLDLVLVRSCPPALWQRALDIYDDETFRVRYSYLGEELKELVGTGLGGSVSSY